MKERFKNILKAGVLFVYLAVGSLLAANTAQASEQKIIFNAQSISFKSGTANCQEICGKRSDPPVGSLLSSGWKVVSSSPKEIVGLEYWYIPCSTCEPHGCTCKGVEYVLEQRESDIVQRMEQTVKN